MDIIKIIEIIIFCNIIALSIVLCGTVVMVNITLDYSEMHLISILGLTNNHATHPMQSSVWGKYLTKTTRQITQRDKHNVTLKATQNNACHSQATTDSPYGHDMISCDIVICRYCLDKIKAGACTPHFGIWGR